MPKLNAPTVNYLSGEYDNSLLVNYTITNEAETPSDIYYTIDGTTPIDAYGQPTSTAIKYTGPFDLNIKPSRIVKAVVIPKVI